LFLGLSEAVVSQAAYVLPVTKIGGLSVLQCYRAAIWLILLGLIVIPGVSNGRYLWEIKVLYFVGHVCIFVWASHDLMGVGGVGRFATFFKMSYWLSWWLCVCLYIRDTRNAHLLLKCLTVAGVLMCVFVYWGFFTGKGLIEAYEQQTAASLGVEGASPKNVPAYLAVAGILSIYLWKDKRSVFSLSLPIFLFGGMMLTYRRSAQAGFIVGMIWLCFWRAFLCTKRRDGAFVGRLVALGLVTMISFLLFVGAEGLEIRWASAAGGGERVRYWLTTLDFVMHEATSVQLLVGSGTYQMLTTMFEGGHGRISTHNDLGNLIFRGGITGCAFYALFFYVVWRFFRKTDWHTPEAAIFGSIVCIFLAMSFLTAQFSAVNAMFIYIGAWTCLPLLAEDSFSVQSTKPVLHTIPIYDPKAVMLSSPH
jgi:hypothetical protein